jgi:hypothetical protein
MKEIIVYGLHPFETRAYREVILSTKCQDQEDIDLIIEKAKLAGFHSFRVANFNWEKPNFVNTIQIYKVK